MSISSPTAAAATRNPRCPSATTNPCAVSRQRASRTGPPLTPYLARNASILNLPRGGYRQDRMSARTPQKIDSTSVLVGISGAGCVESMAERICADVRNVNFLLTRQFSDDTTRSSLHVEQEASMTRLESRLQSDELAA